MSYTKEDFLGFDSYRGILAIIVMISHSIQIFWCPIQGIEGLMMHVFGTLANYAVVGFFFLSGVLISESIKTNVVNNGYFDWKSFFVFRVARIYPPLIASILIAVCYMIFIGDQSLRLIDDVYVAREIYAITLTDVLKTIAMMPPGMQAVNGPLWSLFIEWQMYMLAMGIAGLIFRRNSAGLLMLIPIIYYSRELYIGSEFVYPVVWIFGAIMTLTDSKALFVKAATAVALLSFSFLLHEFGIMGFSIKNPGGVYWISQTFFTAILVILVSKTLRKPNIASRMAKFSYTLYLLHFPTFLFIFSIFHPIIKSDTIPLVSLTVFSIIITLGLSYVVATVAEHKLFYGNMICSILKPPISGKVLSEEAQIIDTTE